MGAVIGAPSDPSGVSTTAHPCNLALLVRGRRSAGRDWLYNREIEELRPSQVLAAVFAGLKSRTT